MDQVYLKQYWQVSHQFGEGRLCGVLSYIYDEADLVKFVMHNTQHSIGTMPMKGWVLAGRTDLYGNVAENYGTRNP